METFPSSAILWRIFTNSFRLSSLRGGMGIRITLPSLDGLSPRSADWIAFSTSPMSPLSKGWTTSSVGSGV